MMIMFIVSLIAAVSHGQCPVSVSSVLQFFFVLLECFFEVTCWFLTTLANVTDGAPLHSMSSGTRSCSWNLGMFHPWPCCCHGKCFEAFQTFFEHNLVLSNFTLHLCPPIHFAQLRHKSSVPWWSTPMSRLCVNVMMQTHCPLLPLTLGHWHECIHQCVHEKNVAVVSQQSFLPCQLSPIPSFLFPTQTLVSNPLTFQPLFHHLCSSNMTTNNHPWHWLHPPFKAR